jgi:hypothetical protein
MCVSLPVDLIELILPFFFDEEPLPQNAQFFKNSGSIFPVQKLEIDQPD